MARRAATVAPEKVTDVDSWLSYYKLKRANIKMGDDGALLVLDPELLKDLAQAYATPLKIIPHQRAEDMIRTLASDVDTGLRAAAEAKRKSLDEAIAANANTAKETYVKLESDLLEAVDAWQTADTTPKRIEAAQRVGDLSRELTQADSTFRSAMYPYRTTIVDTYTEHDKVQNVTRPVLDIYTPAERSIPITVKDTA